MTDVNKPEGDDPKGTPFDSGTPDPSAGDEQLPTQGNPTDVKPPEGKPPEGEQLKNGDNPQVKTVPYERLALKTKLANDQSKRADDLAKQNALLKAQIAGIKSKPAGDSDADDDGGFFGDPTGDQSFNIEALTNSITEKVTESVNTQLEGLAGFVQAQAAQQQISELKQASNGQFNEAVHLEPVQKIMEEHGLSAEAAFRLTKSYMDEPDAAAANERANTFMDTSSGGSNNSMPSERGQYPAEVENMFEAVSAQIKDENIKKTLKQDLYKAYTEGSL